MASYLVAASWGRGSSYEQPALKENRKLCHNHYCGWSDIRDGLENQSQINLFREQKLWPHENALAINVRITVILTNEAYRACYGNGTNKPEVETFSLAV